jgi:ABC-2 type transport system permease protein
MRPISVALALIRTSLMSAMQYRSDFLFESLTGILRTFGSIAPLFLVYAHTDRIAGWTPDEAMLVMALFQLLSAFHGGLMEPNLGAVVEAIRDGTLDLWLLKPADAQLLVSIRKIDPAHLWDVLAAVVIGGWALSRIGAPSPMDALAAGILLVAGFSAMYGVWILAICTSFFWVRVDNLRYLLMSAADAGRWPIDVFSGWVRFAFTAIVPVALVTSFPASALRGIWGREVVGVALLVAVAFLALSRLAWTRSLGSYTSASS